MKKPRMLDTLAELFILREKWIFPDIATTTKSVS